MYLLSKYTTKKSQKNKEDIKEEIDESLVNDETDNIEIEEKARMVEKPEDATKVVQKFKEISSSIKKHIIWLAFHQGMIFEMFKQGQKFSNIIRKFGVSRLTILFKIAFAKLINEYPKKKKHIEKNTLLIRKSEKFVKKILANINTGKYLF